MRFRRLELVRYGAFADRIFDFGERLDGRPDLHLVLGPNEAGKSTALQAIGDLLFGIPPTTTQKWRFEPGQLRIRALIEHGGGVIDVTRRKGNKNTLLDADGAAFDHDPLSPLLGGVDRAAFERMFGLDNGKLRSGGEAILNNSDDAARITLEAGTGIANIGRELNRLQELAASLFKSGGQNPVVNRLMRERADALAEVRKSSIGDSEWTLARQRRDRAEERRRELIEEADLLEREHARLERLSRARAPLSRLGRARAEIEQLGDVPVLPADAAERLADARSERGTAKELVVKAKDGLSRIEDAIAELPAAGPLLQHRASVEALEERRPVIAQAALDVGRRKAELERIDGRIAAARREAHLLDGAELPSAGWRRRAAAHLEASRMLAQREKAITATGAKLARDRAKAEDGLSRDNERPDPATLQAALAKLPADADTRQLKARAELDRRDAQVARLLKDLTPWRGELHALAALDCFSDDQAGEVRRAIEAARIDLDSASKDATRAGAAIAREKATLQKLVSGGTLPTPEVVGSVREERDGILADVRQRLVGDRSADDELAGRALADAIWKADSLADRRDAEAARVAEHQQSTVALNDAVALRSEALTWQEQRRADLASIEAAWAGRLQKLGFERAVPPADWPGWATRRRATLSAMADRDDAARELATETERLALVRQVIAAALLEADGGSFEAADPKLLERAAAHAATLEEAAARRGLAEQALADIEEERGALALEQEALAVDRSNLAQELANLMAEAGMQAEASATALSDALEAVLQVTDDAAARDGLIRQIEGIERDRQEFEKALDGLLNDLGIQRAPDCLLQVRTIAGDLRDAIRGAETRERLKEDRSTIEAELAAAESRSSAAKAVIEELLKGARVSEEAELDRVMASAARLAELRAAENQALADLAGLDNGLGLDQLEAEVSAVTLEEEGVERSRLEERRRHVAAEREEVGRALAQAEAEAADAASSTAAADAQQRVAEAASALAQSAEEHVEAAAAAALLRWVVDRHRAKNQAPLIERAGQLFAKVTAGAFSNLVVEYGTEDRPLLIALRSDGGEVGVEALSEGTRDQLYLALRLASIAGQAIGTSLPIICDDLLITADDQRAGELIRVLGTAAMGNQVILFSHHDHILSVAERAVGADNFRVHRIARVPAAA